MNCPKCLGTLKEQFIENTKVDVCWVCEGIWFDAKELEKVLAADSVDFKYLDIDRKEFDGQEAADLRAELDEKIGICPKCQPETTLQKMHYPKGVTVDICPQCKGVWLDGGEILKLRDRTLVKLHDGIKRFATAYLNGIKSMFKKKDKI